MHIFFREVGFKTFSILNSRKKYKKGRARYALFLLQNEFHCVRTHLRPLPLTAQTAVCRLSVFLLQDFFKRGQSVGIVLQTAAGKKYCLKPKNILSYLFAEEPQMPPRIYIINFMEE